MRQTGRTTKQMQEAPKKAVFVWCNDVLGYPLALQHRAGRADLEVVSLNWLMGYRYVGRELTGIVIDHEIWDMTWTPAQCDNLEYHIERAKTYIRLLPSGV